MHNRCLIVLSAESADQRGQFDSLFKTSTSIVRALPALLTMVIAFTATSDLIAESKARIRHIQPDLDRGASAAVVVNGAELIHTAQLLPLDAKGQLVGRDNRSEQVRQLLRNLDRVLTATNASMQNLVKINVYVTELAVLYEFSAQLSKKLKREPGPAISSVISALPGSDAKVALDAVVAKWRGPAHAQRDCSERLIGLSAPIGAFGAQNNQPLVARSQVRLEQIEELPRKRGFSDTALVPRGDIVYISGQAAQGTLRIATRETLKGLQKTLEHLKLNRAHVAQVKCFMHPMQEVAVVEQEIKDFFDGQTVPPVSYVEWISSLPIEIEIVAAAPQVDAEDTVTYLTPPWMKSSPVFSRVARLHGDSRIFVSGLHSATRKTAEQETRGVFAKLDKILKSAGSDMQHLVKATYYVSTNEVSSALSAVRPSVYDPKRPPAASKAMVKGVAMRDRTLTLDMIAAPAKIPAAER